MKEKQERATRKQSRNQEINEKAHVKWAHDEIPDIIEGFLVHVVTESVNVWIQLLRHASKDLFD